MSQATDQATPKTKRASPISGTPPPDGFEKYPERRNPGGWKKSDTARYKLEQMMKLSSAEIDAIADDVDAPLFERKLAIAIVNGDWKIIEGMTNQVYGYPKQSVEQVNLTPPPPLSPRKKLKLPKKPIDKSK